jgi:hypothetical protein
MKKHIEAGYVTDGQGQWAAQIPNPNSLWGFYLSDGEQKWNGGHGAGLKSWKLVPAEQVPMAIRRRLGHLIDDYHNRKGPF